MLISAVGIQVSFALADADGGDVVNVLAHVLSSRTALLVYKAARVSAYLAFFLAAAFSALVRARSPPDVAPVEVELRIGAEWGEPAWAL